MKDETSKANNENEIRAIIDERVKAVGDKDLNALMSHHAPDVLTFDVLDPLQNIGADAIKERAEKWLTAYQTAIGYEMRDLQITADAAVAFCHYLYRVSGTLKDGGEVKMWVRATICLSKNDGKWMIVHEHQSVPFNVETGKVSLDLKP
ncbi:MAG: SgcJ/EcaC family oxidoreductase [Actinomycetota bacterium]